MVDVQIIENLNGGDAQLSGNDFAICYGIENMVYLAMFGGNPGYPTLKRKPGEMAGDWWGNLLLMGDTPTQQANSYTEAALNNVSLTSAGRVLIEDAIKKDLDFMKSFGTLSVDVSIVSDDRIKVIIKIIEKIGGTKISIVNFVKSFEGDWFYADFDKTDFFV